MKLFTRLSRLWLPITALVGCYVGWGVLNYRAEMVQSMLPKNIDYSLLLNIAYGILLVSIYNVMASLINIITQEINQRYLGSGALPRFVSLKRLLKITVLLVIVSQTLTVDINPRWHYAVYQFIRVVGTTMLGWFLFELIQIGEALLFRYTSNNAKGIDARQRQTHISIVKRILTLLLAIITVAFVLMGFERIRAAGTAILAAGGVFATIVGFSARGLLENIFKGIQLIIAQPIRLLDTVAINGEVGVVTSITLHHVVVTLNDQSQLIVPTGDFLEKTFKNWTHSSNSLTGNVPFYIKYRVSTDLVTKKFKELLAASQYWDQAVGKVQVSELKSDLVELKLIMSAKSASDFSKLRNEILEQLLAYMQSQHPQDLP